MPHLPLPPHLPDAAKFAISVAVGCAYILHTMLGFVGAMSPRSPVLDAAVGVVFVTTPATFLLGVVLLYVHVTPPAAAPAPGAVRRVADLACALAFALIVAVAAFLVLLLVGGAYDGSSSCGFTPT